MVNTVRGYDETCITNLDELRQAQRLRVESTNLDHVVTATAIRQWRRGLSARVKAGSGHFDNCLGLSKLHLAYLVIFVAEADDTKSFALLIGLHLP